MTAPGPDALRDEAAGYALGALGPEEAREFEAALARSPELAALVGEYREVNALLALGAAARPSPALRSRLVEGVRTTRVTPLRRRAANPSWLLGGLLAASLMLAAGLALKGRELERRLSDTRGQLTTTQAELAQREQTLNTLLTAQAELTVVQLKATGENAPGIQFFWNRKANTAVAHAFRLPPAPQGKAYQLWVLKDGKPLPGPVFSPDADGSALVLTFALPVGGIQAAAVTVEPAAGSTTPTMPIILFGQVGGP